MPYRKPDVFVTVEIPEVQPTIETPTLVPAMVGEHYFVAKDRYVGAVTGGGTTFSYPGLPNAKNVDATPLAVDATGEFAPSAFIITEEGGTVDVTSLLTFSAAQITVPAGVTAGDLFVSYRARNDEYAGLEQKLLIAKNTEDLLSLFGADGLGPANPLGYAMWVAMSHGQVSVAGVAVTNPVASGVGSYTAVIANEPLAYGQALDFLKAQDVHSLTLLTDNSAVMDLAIAHANDMSSELGKSERRVLFVPDMSGDVVVRGGATFGLWNEIADNGVGTALTDAMAGLAVGDVYDLGGYPVLKVGAAEFYTKGLVVGTVSIDGNDYDVTNGVILAELASSAVTPSATRVRSSDSFVVSIGGTKTPLDVTAVGVVGDDKLVKLTNSGAAAVVAGPFQFTRAVDPVTDRAAYVAAYKQLPRAYADERLVLINPEFVYDAETEQDVPSYYVAAKLAGEISRVGIQQAGESPGASPLGFQDSKSNLFRSSRYFTDSELREIGGSGWTLLVNDSTGSPVKTQHTVTTDMTSPEYYELILGVERDFLARYFRQELRKDIRKFRIEDATLNAIALKCDAIASALSSPTSQSRCFRRVSVVSVIQDPLQKDQVYIEIEAVHLYPVNRAKVRVRIAL